MKKILLLTVILSACLTINAQDFKAKYGITTSIQGSDAVIGASIPVNNVISVVPTIGLEYDFNTNDHSELYGVAVQINMGSKRLVPYGIVRYGYSSNKYSMYGIGYGGEYYFLPRVSANIELQLNVVDNVLTTGTGLGVTFYFGE